jgi:hypothetical protein
VDVHSAQFLKEVDSMMFLEDHPAHHLPINDGWVYEHSKKAG